MEPPKPGMKRVTVRPNRPNPLFEQWLDEWRQEAAEKGSDMQYCFGKALKSLRKYPLRLRSGKECVILECFGNRLCQLLDRKLVEYRKTHPEMDLVEDNIPAELDAPALAPAPAKKRKTSKGKKGGNDSQSTNSTDTVEPPEKVPRRTGGREYVPAWGSGPFAILVTLLNQEEKPNYPGFMLKAELQLKAQPLCDKSFTRPDPGSHYTAWSSMSQLVKKDLVSRCSNPAKFSLTNEGREMAIRLRNRYNVESNGEYQQTIDSPTRQTRPVPVQDCLSPNQEPEPLHSTPQPKSKAPSVSRKVTTNVNNGEMRPSVRAVSPIPHSSKELNCKSKSSETDRPSSRNLCDTEGTVELQSGTFDVLLLVDTCETGGATKKNHNQTVSELTQMKVPFEVRKLEVGDFAWIARSKNSRADELVLPYIVERKRMDDLGGSIKDGRFKEQKFRLKQSGIQNLIYLVESHGSDQHVGLPLSTVQQAAVNTQVVDGFIVKHTIDHRHSMAYLASLTRILGQTFLNKTLFGCPKKDLAEYTMADDFIFLMNFKEFKLCTKKNRNFSVKEMFIRQLVQMKGLSVEKAIAIVGRYPTPQAIVQAYRFGGDENLLADIPCLGTTTSRSVGPATSKAVHFLYNSAKLR
ncbi:hypothetical protein FOCC_FOCC016039 [Frankliniella occidentalis]|uniref:Crossover junction endonuclease MUS81 n=1 Tax=Frankliniella occidentalis TaxID=133901 RepID=A0A6J1SB97_FRAOC|nr:crossover junction endonuclease MUS81 [Frankliniella occidentalis]KAE8738479.1 hypothetical protein FOCC_FOCC016039 [Frankliniella occidentalis]